jgi:hypothetical protein
MKYSLKLRYDTAALISVSIVMVGAIGLRFYYSWVTGYVLPDEAYYYSTFVLDGAKIGGYKEVFHAIFLLFFYGTNGILSFFLRGLGYTATWSIGSLLVANAILKRLQVGEKASALLLLSLPLLPVFTVLSVSILGETLGLLLGFVGMYFMLRYLQSYRAREAFISSVCFVLAFRVREQYMLLALGNLLVMFLADKRNLRAVLVYVLPLLLVCPVPVSIIPLTFAQPIYRQILGVFGLGVSASQINQDALLSSNITNTVTLTNTGVFRSFLLGMLYGYNPLFTAFAFVSLGVSILTILKKRSQRDIFISVNVVSAFLAFFTSLYFVISWLSTIIRMSHSSVPSLFGFRYLYEKVNPRFVAAALIIFLVLASSQFPQFVSAMQPQTITGQPMNRLSFEYRAPYYRLYQLAEHSGKTLVVGGLEMRGIRLYMSMLPNVLLVPAPKNESGFNSLLNQSWDTIFLYDDWYTIKDPSALFYPTYYRNMVLTGSYPGYALTLLWADQESYAFTMTKISSAPTVP